MSAYTNFAFEGGGVNGVAYCGAIQEMTALLDPRFVDKTVNFAGSSVGAIFAAGLAAGASNDYIERKMRSIDFNSFRDDSMFCAANIYRVVNEYGFYKGDVLEEFMGEMMHELTGDANITLKRLPKNLVVTGTEVNQNGCTTRYFSRVHYPEMQAKKACRISGSFPLFFRSLTWGDRRWVDGGLLNNYPVAVFDTPRYVHGVERYRDTTQVVTRAHSDGVLAKMKAHDEETANGSLDCSHTRVKCDYFNNATLGFKIINSGESEDTVDFLYEDEPEDRSPQPANLCAFAESMAGAVYDQCQNLYIKPRDWDRTVRVNVGDSSSLNFDLTSEQKDKLIECGRVGAREFIKRIKD